LTTVAVTRVTAADSPEGIREFGLTHPRAGSAESVYSLPLEGWVVPADVPPDTIIVHGAHRPLPRAPVTIERPDVAILIPELPWARSAGFALRVNALELPQRFRLAVSVDLTNGGRVRLGTIEGKRRPLPEQKSRYRPLMVTTIGRSGSTWLTWLLGQHADIADFRSFEYESKVAPYFAEALRLLTRPASYYQSMRGEIDYSGWWRGSGPSWPLNWHTSHDSIDQWLGSEHVDDLIGFFAGRIDALFGRIALALGKEDARYVVEKMPPRYFGQPLLGELFPGSREIVLVRDFRDVAASIIAFGEKRGRLWYEGLTPAEIVREPLRNDVDQLVQTWHQRSDSAFLLRYEDLVLRPAEALSEVLSYLELDARPETVARMLAAAGRIDGAVQEPHVTSATGAQSIGRWRRDLPPELRRLCEESLGNGLEAFGYA
jgi:hypothetical protein